MRLSMVCATRHTWGRCWRKEGDLLLESFPRGWHFVGIVPISLKLHYIYFRLWHLWKLSGELPISPCHTLCTTGRYVVLVGDM